MRLVNPFSDFAIAELFDSLLPDFLLAFTFFTGLIYAVLGKRFGRERPAVAMYGVLGLSLAIALVLWEHEQGWSIRDLGPVALGFLVILLGMVMYKAIRQVGGSWAGGGIALGASILVAWMMGFDWPVATEIVQTVMAVGLTVGILAFLIHGRSRHAFPNPVAARTEFAGLRHDMADLYRDRGVGNALRNRFHKLRRKAAHLPEHPQETMDVMRQLKQMLPAEGWLTQQFDQLRKRAHAVRSGQLRKIEELRHVMGKLPRQARDTMTKELAAQYQQLKLDLRLERLEKVVAENERRVRDLTGQAQQALSQHDHRALIELLADAEKLQKHNTSILKTLERTEQKLARITAQVAKEAPQREAT